MTDQTGVDKNRNKWNRIYHDSTDERPLPCSVLADHSYLIPPAGGALDIACGRGGNALYLAMAGLTTTAIDLSDVGIEKLQRHAATEDLKINTIVAAASEAYFAGNTNYNGLFDVITVANYLDRRLFNVLPDLLAPGGLLFYQTFVRDKSVPGRGPSKPEFLLETNELLTLTSSLVCRVFYDLGTTGDASCGLRNQSCIVAQKGG